MSHRVSHEQKLSSMPATVPGVSPARQAVPESVRDGRPLGPPPTRSESPVRALHHRTGVPYPLDYLRLSLDAELREITSNCESS